MEVPDRGDSPHIFGVRIDAVRTHAIHKLMLETVRGRDRALILNVNAHGLNLAYEQPWLKAFFNSANTVFADGSGVLLAGRLLGFKLPERITYAEWIWDLSRFGARSGLSFFFLGSRPGIAEEAAAQLGERYPKLQIRGTHHGYFGKRRGGRENREVIQKINALKPNIVVVGMGMPLQERWLQENWEYLNANIALTGGAVFDYISGRLRRSPRMLRAHGFEWLGRFLIEPKRLWRRYLLGNPLFLFRVLKQRSGVLEDSMSSGCQP